MVFTSEDMSPEQKQVNLSGDGSSLEKAARAISSPMPQANPFDNGALGIHLCGPTRIPRHDRVDQFVDHPLFAWHSAFLTLQPVVPPVQKQCGSSSSRQQQRQEAAAAAAAAEGGSSSSSSRRQQQQQQQQGQPSAEASYSNSLENY